MMASTISSSNEIPQPDYEDLDASELPNPPTPDQTTVSTISSSNEIPQPDYKDPDTSEQPKPSTPNDTMASTTSSSNENPQPDYEDPDASLPAVTDGSQSENKVKPVPRPRSKMKKKAQCDNSQSNSNSSDPVHKTNNPTNEESSQNNHCPPENKRSHPVRPPPPMSKLLTSSKPTAETGGGNQYMSSNTEPAGKPPAVCTERTQNLPSRPDRPPPPSIYYGTATGTQSKSCPEESQQSTHSSSSSKQTPVSPAHSEEVLKHLDGIYGEMATDSKDKPAVPPRPKQNLLPSYATPLQIRPLPPLPATETPPEPLYTEITELDNRPYLEILPNKDDEMIKPPPPTQKPSGSVRSEKNHRYVDHLPRDDDKMKQERSLRHSSGRYSSHPQSMEDTDEISGMLRWLRKVSKADYMTPSVYGLSIEEEIRSFNQRATNVSKALRLYNLLMMKRNESLRNTITEFNSISDSLDKMQKKTKTMGIAGGTTGAVGGVTAVVGLALAPVTLGASLIATAVGAGMVASAGGISVHTAKASKNIVNRTTVEKLVSDYMANVVDLEQCLDFILSGMNELRRHDIARLHRAGTQSEAVKMAHLSQSVFRNNANYNMGTSVPHPGGIVSERLLLAFLREMDQYFTENNGQKLKKLSKSKFSGRVRLLAENLQDELEYLNHMWEIFT